MKATIPPPDGTIEVEAIALGEQDPMTFMRDELFVEGRLPRSPPLRFELTTNSGL
jgi:hypothetical protein